MGHIYFGKAPNRLNSYVEYIISWVGNINNIKKEVRLKMEEIIKQVNPNIEIPRDKRNAPLIRIEHLSLINDLKLIDKIFDVLLQDKFSSNKFDSYIVPPLLTRDKFLNRNPYEIKQETAHLDISKKIIKDLLERGFPIKVGKGLYVFYTPDMEKIDTRGLFENLYTEDTIGKVRYLRFFENRDYWNVLVFFVNLMAVLYNLHYHIEISNDLIIWKKQQMEGSLFTIPGENFKKIYKLLGKSRLNPTHTNLYYLLELLLKLWNLLRKSKKEKMVEKLADEFSYYLLIKQMLDTSFVNNLIKIIVDVTLKQNERSIKNLNKLFIIKFMEEVTGHKMDEYFELGQELQKSIYAMVERNFEQFDKLIDRLAKDLRNEELPEYFAETFEKNIVWLKSRGLKISKDLSEKFAKLMYELRTSDLSRFYLIKASLILGLLSPFQKAEEISEIEAE